MISWTQDFRYSVRVLSRSKLFSLSVIGTLALAIGANAATFSLINALLFPDLQYKDRDRLVSIQETDTNEINLANYEQRLREFDFFESIGGHRIIVHYLTGQAEAKRLVGWVVTSGFLPTLGVQPKMGRTFLPQEDVSGAPLTVVLSEELWSENFSSDPNIIGKTIRMNDQSYEVIGVMPRDFRHTSPTVGPPFWTSLAAYPFRTNQTQYRVNLVARLKPGMTLEQAQTRVDAVAQGWKIAADFKLVVRPLAHPYQGREQFEESGFSIFTAAVVLVLMIACANIANLLLARGMTRTKEISIRIALGANRTRIIQQLLIETTLLCLTGGALGLLLTFVFRDSLFRYGSQILWALREVPINQNVAFFAAGVSLLAGVLTGLVPALQTSRVDLNTSLKEGGQRSGSTGHGHQVRSFLVVMQVALSLVLLIGAGLMLKSFRQMQRVDFGYNPEGLLAVSLELPSYKYEGDAAKEAFYETLAERLRGLPQHRVGLTTGQPWDVGPAVRIATDEGHQSENAISYTNVSPDFLQTLGATVLRGRHFGPQDERLSRVIVNQTMARRFWGNEPIIGRTITLNFEESSRHQIIGVIRDLNRSPDEPNEPHMYLPFGQGYWRYLSIVARSKLPKQDAVSAVKNVLRTVDKEVPIALEPMLFTELIDELMQRKRLILLLVSLFAAVAICLALLGTYATVQYATNQKKHEFGVRIFVGASPGDILRMVFRQGMRLVFTGIALGLLLCLSLKRILQSYLFGISTTDPWTYVSISFLLIVVALIACLIPARRAAATDPASILRSE